MEQAKNRREWIKNIAIIFLAALLVLTFFSGTIRNRSLPEVAVSYAMPDSVSSGVRVSGTANAAKSYALIAPATRTVKTVLVRNGDEVAAGDVILELEDEESAELTEARQTLQKLEDDYQIEKLQATAADTKAETAAVTAAEAAYTLAARNLQSYNDSVASTPEYKALAAANRSLQSLKLWYGESYDTALAGVSAETAIAYYAANVGVEDPAAMFSGEGRAFADLTADYAAYKSTVTAAAQGEVSAAEWALQKAKAEYTDALTAADADLTDAKQALAAKQTENANGSKVAAIENAATEKEIALAREKVAKLEAESTDYTVTAKQAGMVSDLNVLAGDKLEADATICNIQLTDTGYTCEISLTAEQAARVQIGSSAGVSGYYWGDTPTAVVSSMRTDPATRGNKIVTLTLTGSIEPGGSYNFTLGERSSSYETVVPKSALHEDNTGTFVLVITNKSTPLGTNYYATRTDVKVLAQDDTKVAVSGDFTGWDYVVTSASAPISAGTQVRLSES